jgi:hypothetical protein
MFEGPQLTREQAIAFGDSGAWESLSFEERARFQLGQECLCMPFDIFHEAITKALDRPVYTHEFAMPELLMVELNGDAPAPTFEQILGQIPVEKRIVIDL